MSAKGTLFAFIPDFYLTGATRFVRDNILKRCFIIGLLYRRFDSVSLPNFWLDSVQNFQMPSRIFSPHAIGRFTSQQAAGSTEICQLSESPSLRQQDHSHGYAVWVFIASLSMNITRRFAQISKPCSQTRWLRSSPIRSRWKRLRPCRLKSEWLGVFFLILTCGITVTCLLVGRKNSWKVFWPRTTKTSRGSAWDTGYLRPCGG